MKFYCVLFSFAFVNILAVDVDDCKKAGLITNELLRQICDNGDFRSVIKEIIVHEKYTMEKLAFMFAAPELAATEDHDISQCIKYEQDIQKEILETVNSLEVPGTLNVDMKYATLKDVGFGRRVITKLHIKSLLMDIQNYGEINFSPIQLCHLTGMYKNALFLSLPLAFIKTVRINDLGQCELIPAMGDSIYCKLSQNTLIQVWIDIPNEMPILSWPEI